MGEMILYRLGHASPSASSRSPSRWPGCRIGQESPIASHQASKSVFAGSCDENPIRRIFDRRVRQDTTRRSRPSATFRQAAVFGASSELRRTKRRGSVGRASSSPRYEQTDLPSRDRRNQHAERPRRSASIERPNSRFSQVGSFCEIQISTHACREAVASSFSLVVGSLPHAASPQSGSAGSVRSTPGAIVTVPFIHPKSGMPPRLLRPWSHPPHRPARPIGGSSDETQACRPSTSTCSVL